MILILIILNAVVLTIQAFGSLTLPASGNPSIPPHIKGYFHTWEDYALFALFIIFTCVHFRLFFVLYWLLNILYYNSLEAFARICVNGFLFDPEIPLFSSSSSPLQSEPYTSNLGGVGASLPAGAIGTGMEEMARQATLNRGQSITQRLRRFHRGLLRPFALVTQPSLSHSDIGGGGNNRYPYEATPVDGGFSTVTFNGQTQAPSHNQIHHRDTSLTFVNATDRTHTTIREPTYLSRVMRSDANKADSLSLPFRLSIFQLHSKTKRNVPYLRQSWTRIDFLAIVCFWITFGLATAGFEHGNGGLHLGVFRAISVIRTARLLSVTSGTTVSFCFFFFF